MDIEVVFDDDLMDDELTGVLVRSAPLEVSAMPEISSAPDFTEPCPLVVDDEFGEPTHGEARGDGESHPAPVIESSDVELSSLVAEAAEVAFDAVPDLPSVESSAPPTAEPRPAEMVIDASPAPPSPVELLLEAPLAEPLAIEFAFDAPSAPPPAVEVILETPPFDSPLERHGETLPLALVVAPVAVELAPAPRLPMPKPRPSDVEDLLERMAQAQDEGSDELRSSLKGLAGLEPTPPPPLPET
jgi:hypothetical protein